MVKQFRSAFTEDTLISAATTQTVAGTFGKLGEYKVQAGEMVAVGFGMHSGQDNAEGRIYLDIRNSTTAVDGMVRISAYSPQNRPLEVLAEYRTETLRTDQADRTLQVALPIIPKALSEDRKLVLEFNPDVSGEVTKAQTTLLMDVTKYEVR